MSIPPIPPPLEQLGGRPFSFYPSIVNVEHNEWVYRRATWSEVLVANTHDNLEVWIPRRILGEISRIDDPVVIVGLVKELEYKGGAVWPYQRRVIEMPMAVGEGPRPPAGGPEQAAPVVAISLGSGTESRLGRLVMGTMAFGILACVLVVSLNRGGALRPRVTYTTRDQSYLELNKKDDFYAVVRKLGPPENDRWQNESGEIQYRALSYPKRAYTIILMGENRKQTSYIGTVDDHWRPVAWVPLPGGGDTRSLLSGLRKF